MHLIKNIKTKIVWSWVAAFVFYFSIFLVQYYFDGGAWSRGIFKALAGATYMTVCMYVVVRLFRWFSPVKHNRRNAKQPRIPIINKTVPMYVVRMLSTLVGMIVFFLSGWWMQSYGYLTPWTDYKDLIGTTAIWGVAMYFMAVVLHTSRAGE